MTEYQTTYGEIFGRLQAIKSGVATNPVTGEQVSIYEEGEKPLYRRRLSAGALLAIRRFVKVLESAQEDYNGARDQILEDAREELTADLEEGEELDPNTQLPRSHIDRLNDLVRQEVTIQVSKVPVEVLVEEPNLDALDLEFLDPIIAEE